MPRLFCFGLGYTAGRLADRLMQEDWEIAGTVRTEDACEALAARGIAACRWDGSRPLEDPGMLAGATCILVSIPPVEVGDPVLSHHAEHIAALPGLRWLGYLSSTSVYGGTGGRPVDESAPCAATSPRGRRRIAAEAAWLECWRAHGTPVHIFRLAGIYGPGRSALDQVRAGTARRIDRPDHLFSRAHVDDIAAALRASMARPDPGAVYNVCDDEPAAGADVVAFACGLLGVPPPPLIAFDDAALSPMARSFYADNRRVCNGRIRTELGVTLRYPDYRAGLRAILAEEGGG